MIVTSAYEKIKAEIGNKKYVYLREELVVLDREDFAKR